VGPGGGCPHEALRANGLTFDLDKGGGSFYGPKIDIDVEDTLGRQWQLATIQVDLTMLPERMQCEYIDSDGQPKRPVVIHRAIFGSYERFIAILTEHFAGAFPSWLAPVQARVLPSGEKHLEYATSVHARLRAAGFARGSTTGTRSWAIASARRRCTRCRTPSW
jgi:Threonyl-tRNA synthetase